MFSEDEKVFIQFIEETLIDNQDKITVAKILHLNKLISDLFYYEALADYGSDNDPEIISENFIFGKDIREKLKYLCALMNDANNVEIPNFFSFFDNRYNEGQITEICKACISGAYRAALYWPELPADKMKMLRELAKDDIEADMIIDSAYSIEQAEEIYKAAQAHLPLYYVKPQRDVAILEAFRYALQDNLDCTAISEHDYCYEQLEVIFDGMREGVDITQVCDKSYTSEQMKELLLGLLQNVDIETYNDLKYDWEQMRQIRVGLKEGIDVSVFATEDLSAYYMEVLRLSMLNGDGIQFYGNTYNEETGRSCDQGRNFSIDDALESKRLPTMSVF